MQRILSLTMAVIIFILVTLLVTGYFVGEKYSGKQELIVDYNARVVWDILEDFEHVGLGKTQVISVDALGKYFNLYAWKENLKNGGYRKYRQIEKKVNEKMVVELTESTEGLTGTWTFYLREDDNRTIITIEEESTNTSLLNRGYWYYLDPGKETTQWVKYLRVRIFGKLLQTP